MIACLAVPYFVATVERRHDTELAQTSLVVGGRPWETRPLFGFSQEAARQGVRPGMPLRHAHVLSPDSRFLPAELDRYLGAAGEVVDVLTDFTPLVAPEEVWQSIDRKQWLPAGARTLPARYTVDLEGLPQREALPLAQEMGRTVRGQTGLEPAVGLADDAFTAQVAATMTRPNHLRPVDSSARREFLAERAFSFLPLEKETARRLRLLGIRTLGELAALTPAAVREQFGSDFLPLYRLARGETETRVPAPAPDAEEVVTRRLEAPLANWLAVEKALEQMAAILAERLAAEGMAAQTLRLRVEAEGERPRRLSLPLRRLTADAGRLGQAVRDLARSSAITAGITTLTVALSDLEPAAAQQLSLFRRPGQPAVIGNLAQIMARHRTAHFLQPVPADVCHPLPERRFALRPLL